MRNAMPRSTIIDTTEQMSLATWAEELEDERGRIAEVNERRAASRGFLVFATDPERSPEEPGYRDIYATEARTPGEAASKVRPLADGRRLHTYLATGTYKHELADARWVA
jgi:hypothetical protein